MRILMLQKSACIRNIKYSLALRSAGHYVGLAYITFASGNKIRYIGIDPDSIYDESYKVRDGSHLYEIMQDYDIVHSHNAGDELTVLALAGSRPVIHDTHDAVSLYKNEEITPFQRKDELMANYGATGRIYVTPVMAEYVYKTYRIPESKHWFGWGNRVSKAFIGDGEGPVDDGKIKIVYEGGINLSGHRNFPGVFKQIVSMDDNITIDIYPAIYDENVYRVLYGHANIRYHLPVSPFDIIGRMRKYDLGINPYFPEHASKWEEHLQHSVPNKLYEYWAAGLSVLVPKAKSFCGLLEGNPGAGAIFTSLDDVVEMAYKAKQDKDSDIIAGMVDTYEDHIPKLVNYYERVINEYRG